MAKPDLQADPQFSQPVRQILLMILVLGLVAAGAVFALPQVMPVFLANPYLNGFIGITFVIGVLATFLQVFQLVGSVRWIEGFAAGVPREQRSKPPKILAALASLLGTRDQRTYIAASSAQSILDSVAQRIEEGREITRYLVNLLIFLGLLGTFYGLATTVPAVVDTIRSLAPQEGDASVDVFNRLMTGLESQLGGMGTAFSSSLLGLAGSLVVGLLELFAGHGQNRFYRELEDWLSTITRVGFASGGDGDAGEAGVLAFALEQFAERLDTQMDGLMEIVTQSDIQRAALDDRIGGLAQTMDHVLRAQTDTTPLNAALMRVADGQEIIAQKLDALAETGGGLDAESRMRLRSMDVQLLRILEEISAGREETLSELRTDIAALTRIMTMPRGDAGTAPRRRSAQRPLDDEAEG